MESPNPTDGRSDARNDDSTNSEQPSGIVESSFNGDFDGAGERDSTEPLTDFAEEFDESFSDADRKELHENLDIIDYIDDLIDDDQLVDISNSPYRIADEHFGENEDITPERVLSVMESEFSAGDKGVIEGRKSVIERAMDDDPENYSTVTWDEIRDYIQDASARQARQVMAEKLNDEHHWLEVCDHNQEFRDFCWYDPDLGYYVEGGEDIVGELLDAGTNGFSNDNDTREVASKLAKRNRITLDEANGNGAPLRCLKNGVVNVETWEFFEHDPEYHFTRRFEMPWDPDVDTSFVEEFIRDITANEIQARVLEEALGDILPLHAPEDDDVRDWFAVIFGPGGNGKSVLTNTVEAGLGERNVSVESLEDIVNSRWSAAQLAAGYGSVANIASDIAGNTIHDASMLKRLSGRDGVSVEKKGDKKHRARSSARLFFALNEPMMFSERKDSIVRRIKPIEMPYKFKPESEYDPDDPLHKRQDPTMERKLRSDENLAALLQVMVRGLKRLRGDGWSYERTQDELFDGYHREADTLHAFLHECVDQKRYRYTDNDASVYLTSEELTTMYNRFAAERGESGMKKRQLSEQLSNTTVHDIVTFHPNRAGKGTAAKEWLVPTRKGWKYAQNGTRERFELYVDEIDVPSPDSDGDDSEDGESDGDDENGGDTVQDDVVRVISNLQMADAHTPTKPSIMSSSRLADYSVKEVEDALGSLWIDGLVERRGDEFHTSASADGGEADE